MNYNPIEDKWTNNIHELFRTDKLMNIIPTEIPTSLMCLPANTINSITRFLLYYIMISYGMKQWSTFVKDARVALIAIIIIFVFSNIADSQYCPREDRAFAVPMSVAPRHVPVSVAPRHITIAEINNPFRNPTPYTTCKNSDQVGHAEHDIDVGMFDLGELNNVTVNSPTIEFLKQNNNKLAQRSFYKLPVTDCVNDIDKFAKSLYGDPTKQIFKQHSLNNFS